METDGKSLKLSKCDDQNQEQKWFWKERYY